MILSDRKAQFAVKLLPSPVQVASSRKKVSSFTLPSQLKISQNTPDIRRKTKTCCVAWPRCSHHSTPSFRLHRDAGSALRWSLCCVGPPSGLPSTGGDFAAHLVRVLDSPSAVELEVQRRGSPVPGFRGFLSCHCKSVTPTPGSGVLDMRRNPRGARKKPVH